MPHTKPAFDFLESKIPELKERAKNPRSLLYVGWRRDSSRWWYDVFAKGLGTTEIFVLDIFKPNIRDFEDACWEGSFSASAILGDVRAFDEFPLNYFHPDVIFWDHGPEHVSKEDLTLVTAKLLKRVKFLLYACPWGSWPQGEEDGNPNEVHANSVEPEELIQHGMETFTFGKSGQQNEGEIIAYKVTA